MWAEVTPRLGATAGHGKMPGGQLVQVAYGDATYGEFEVVGNSTDGVMIRFHPELGQNLERLEQRLKTEAAVAYQTAFGEPLTVRS